MQTTEIVLGAADGAIALDRANEDARPPFAMVAV